MYVVKVSAVCDLAEWLELLTANAIVATVLGSIPASSDTVESEGRQMKQCQKSYIKKIQKNFLLEVSGAQGLHQSSSSRPLFVL